MSFQSQWVLPEPVQAYGDAALLSRVKALLPEGIALSISGPPEMRTIRARLPVVRVDEIAAKLATREGELGWDWRRDMDPPRSGGDSYDVHIDFVDDDRPILRICSSDGENRAAWPLAFSIASSLADDLGGIPEDEATPPSDRFPMFIEPGKRSKPN